jgi:hypothetical protein
VVKRNERDIMDYEWKKIEEHGQAAIGFIEIYETEIKNRAKVLAIINYFPQLPFSQYEQQATVTFYYEGSEEQITKGLFRSISNDFLELIVNNAEKKFPQKTEKKLDHTQNQFYIVDKLPKLKYYTHGDFGVETVNR